MRGALGVVLAILLCSSASAAKVIESADDAFVVQHEVTVTKDALAAYQAFTEIGRWWSSSHTWSGSAANLSIDPNAGGCWCEKWSGGSVEHGRVVFAKPGAMLRMSAPLGPLQGLGVLSTLTIEIVRRDTRTVVTANLRVSGDSLHKLQALAPGVDGVIVEQLDRFARYVNTGSADAK